MRRLKFSLIGIGRVLMNNGQMVDPMNPFAKQLASLTRRGSNKTEESNEKILKTKFLGSLYHDPRMGLCMPSDAILGSLTRAATTVVKRGGKNQVQVGVDVPPDVDFFPFTFDGYKRDRDTPERLYEQGHRLVKAVRIGKNKVIGCRACFTGWRVDAELMFDPEVINKDTLVTMLKAAGASVGIGDWRPRFGRFNVEIANTRT